MSQDPVRLITIIVERGVGEEAAALLRSRGYPVHFALRGRGTARSEVLRYLGLGETEKDVVLSLLPAPDLSAALREVGERLQLSRHGRGIAFTTRLTAVSAMAAKLSQGPAGKEETEMQEHTPHALILAMVDHGGAEAVMEAAWSVGATGGTILHARSLGLGYEAQPAGAGLSAEKETVVILVPAEIRDAVLAAVNQRAGMHTPLHGVLLSLPVEDVIGI